MVMATTFGLPIGESYLRDKMQKIIDKLGLPDVVFHSIRHTSVTYKLKLSGGFSCKSRIIITVVTELDTVQCLLK